MRGRRTTSRKATKTRNGKVPKPKRGETSSVTLRTSLSVAELQKQVSALTRELAEAREQQTATADLLQVISSSAGDLDPVFAAMLENAIQICEANFGTLFLFDGAAFHAAALHRAVQVYAEARSQPISIRNAHPDLPLFRMAQTKKVLQVADLHQAKCYLEREPAILALVESAGARTLLMVPMLKKNDLLGAFAIYRQEVRPFTHKQIELVENFAAQAVIAIENARLLRELRQRTADLTESLEQQTATSEVLQVISSSPGELQAVFEAMLESATRICEANFGAMYRLENGAVRMVTRLRVPERLSQFLQKHHDSFGPLHPWSRLIQSRRTLHIADYSNDRAYLERDPVAIAGVELGGLRTLLAVPMLKDDELVGFLTIFRQEVRPFTDKQIELVSNFANQAVIAIENARLLNELRQRTTDLTDALEQQTASSEVLRVISSSPGELEAVFRAILENATRICEAKFGMLFLSEGDAFRTVAQYGAPPAWAEARRREPVVRPSAKNPLARVAAKKQLEHITDLRIDEGYVSGDPAFRALAEIAQARTLLVVPMLKENEVIGAIAIYRQEVRPFTDKQTELVSNFAAQAVIAIENARLLGELRQRTDELGRSVGELRALGEVSQAVNSTLDLETVLSTIVAKATQLSGTEAGAIYVFNELQREFHLRATFGMEQELIDAITHQHIDMRDPNVAAVMTEGQPIQVADLRHEASTELNEITLRAGYRARLVAPLIRRDDVVGMLVVRRKTTGAFAQNTIDLMKTFAAQSVLAIQNARLFHEIEDKSRQLEVASQHKSQFLANMSHELRTPLNAILGYTELIADGAYGEPSEKMLEALERLEANGRHLLGLINDVLDLSKIEAGQLVLELTNYSVWDIAQTVRGALEPLAADKKLTFKVEVPARLPPGHGDGRRLTQVLINLVGNAIKFTDAGEIAIKAEVNNGAFYVSVRDTGPGISVADQTKLFQEFQQADNAITKKKGGTGLGLAISKRIIEMHGGRIWVESQPGQGSTFAFTLPVTVERQVATA